MKRFVLYFSIVLSLPGCGPGRVAGYSSSNTSIDSSYSGTSLESLIEPYRLELREEMLNVIGNSDSAMVSYAPESPLGNFVADVIFDRGFSDSQQNGPGADSSEIFCLINFGGIRSAINRGPVTTATIYELMPFDNTIVIVRLTPQKINDLLIAMHASGGQPISNAVVSLSDYQRKIEVGGMPYQFDRDLFVITSDYLANGGDKMNFFKEPVARWDTGILFRDVLIEHIKRVYNLPYSPVEGRVNLE